MVSAHPGDRLRVSFQGAPGAYSHEAALALYPSSQLLPCETFDDAVAAIGSGRADRAVIPIENSAFGRVAEVHKILPDADVFIVGEHFHRVHHCLLAPNGSSFDDITEAWSHPQALGQCRDRLAGWNIQPVSFFDTAAAARKIAEDRHVGRAAIASRLSASIYGLQVLQSAIEDESDNTTRFVVLAGQPLVDLADDQPRILSLMFAVENVPSALVRSLACFGDNHVNLVRLESYQRGSRFNPTEFYVDVEGRSNDPAIVRALDALSATTRWVRVLGEYKQAQSRT